jgi:hypothetical protein
MLCGFLPSTKLIGSCLCCVNSYHPKPKEVSCSYSPVRKFIVLLEKTVVLKNIVFIIYEIKILFKIIFVDLDSIKIVCYMHIIQTLTVF